MKHQKREMGEASLLLLSDGSIALSNSVGQVQKIVSHMEKLKAQKKKHVLG